MSTASTSSAEIIRADALRKVYRRSARSAGTIASIRQFLRPVYKTVVGLHSLDLSIGAGESVAILGPNGAGKSTTIKLLTGVLTPTSGNVQVCGLSPTKERLQNAQNIGVVFGQRTQLWWDLPIIDSFRVIADMYGVTPSARQSRIDRLTHVLELEPLLNVPARQLSLGQRMRCDLAAALLHEPKLLFLDEPTMGLDVAVKRRFREFIVQQTQQLGLTVILTSHDLSDVMQISSRLIMIDQGSALYDGPLQDVQDRFGWEHTIRIVLSEPTLGAEEVVRALVKHQAGLSHGAVTSDLSQIDLRFDSREVKSGEIVVHFARELPIADISFGAPDIEAIVAQLYEGTLNINE